MVSTPKQSLDRVKDPEKPCPSSPQDSDTAVSAAIPQKDPNIVDWDGPDDPHNPRNWSHRSRVAQVALISAITLVLNLAMTLFAPATGLYAAEFNVTNTYVIALLVSIYVLGFALGPLVMAPLSELYGRLWIYHVCNLCFIAFTVGCATSNGLGAFLACRFLSGAVGAAPIAIGGGSIADMMDQESRGKAMAAFVMGPLLGPIIGPIIGGFVADGIGWRWTFWIVAIMAGPIAILCFVFMRETYAPVLLARKAARLRKETGNPDLRARTDEGLSPKELLLRAIVRPTKMLLFSPIVLFLAIYLAFLFGLIFLLFTTFPSVFNLAYGFGPSTAGLAYLGQGIGSFCTALLFAKISDRMLRHGFSGKKEKKVVKAGDEKEGDAQVTGGEGSGDLNGDGGESGGQEADPQVGVVEEKGLLRPENRMLLVPYFTMLVPIGFFWYGWSAETEVHWICTILGTAPIGIGSMWAMMSTQMYVVDVYGPEGGASALAALTVIRCMFGAFLPLAGSPLYEDLGFGWGNSLLGFIAMAFVALPFIFLRYGETLRKKYVVQL